LRSENSTMNNIILCGLPGVGKTTTGKHLAQKLNWPFIDTDHLIEQQHTLSCSEIFRQKGNEVFRSYEREALQTLIGVQQHVIAIGGGSFEDHSNYNVISQLGIMIHLTCEIDILIKRKTENDISAFLKTEPFERMSKRRLPIMEKLQTFSIDISHLSIDNVVAFICEQLREYHGK